ncbi:hypothetical protein Hypma_014379 [Hypsizygus marmoreus]|uniref:BTB domain-containing protein n=1 Tax=Hypsizygus marmoreus TaxID=39966 RepID=A0A369JAP9_HYPMA|nr:hypothetical protein Hypma_014379 [Hypsizygus marmoreus]
MMSAMFDDSLRKYHHIFNSPDGDVILCSTESTFYRLPSYVLRHTTGLFRTMLSPPEGFGEHSEGQEAEPIMVEEKDNIVERLLRLISGLETPKWESFDELEAVISLAEKWDAPGPLSIIRSAITAPVFLTEPLRLYVLATRFGWDEEARLASTYTLTLALYDETHASQLQRLSPKDLMRLLGFHRRRRDDFKTFIDRDERFNAGNAMDCFCSGCGEKIDNHTWRELKGRMFYEMDQRPLGDTLYGLDMEEWPESVACWTAKCGKKECGRLNYNKLTTLRDIKASIDRLPTTI